MKIIQPSVELLSITPNATKLLELAGRTCYKSEDKITEDSADKFVDIICKRKHESVLEHASASFRIICDRGVMAELTRHRIASFSVESTRYCNYSKEKFGQEISVIEPPGLDVENARVIWISGIQAAEVSYFELLSRGISPQIARSVLPTCLKTELVMTANFREFLHFLKLRTAPDAHPQMREIAFMIKEILAKECPILFNK